MPGRVSLCTPPGVHIPNANARLTRRMQCGRAECSSAQYYNSSAKACEGECRAPPVPCRQPATPAAITPLPKRGGGAQLPATRSTPQCGTLSAAVQRRHIITCASQASSLTLPAAWARRPPPPRIAACDSTCLTCSGGGAAACTTCTAPRSLLYDGSCQGEWSGRVSWQCFTRAYRWCMRVFGSRRGARHA